MTDYLLVDCSKSDIFCLLGKPTFSLRHSRFPSLLPFIIAQLLQLN
jgi:hypothetical protein